MNRSIRATGMAVAAAAALGIAPTAEPSDEALAMLDPSARLASLCGGKDGAASLRGRLLLAAAYAATRSDAPAGPMPLLDGLPPSRMTVTTRNDEARRYFDQGLMLTYGFNHGGAIRSFREAQRLDPQCALCFWGEAIAYGPNINAPMAPDARAPALAAVRRAQALRGGASPSEQALIDAAAVRYSADPDADRGALDRAYADAMAEVAGRFPDDDDIAVLAAEAIMDTSPWNYWETDRRTPNGRIADAIAGVERVIARNPHHPQAAHLYIHLMEASDVARRAESAADRLARPIVPGAGHLVHMPAHIYYRLGRWNDSIRANVAAARADEDYLARVGADPIYRYGYYPHNVHFILTSAQMAGDMETAVRESARLSSILDAEVAAGLAWIQPIQAAPYFAHAQFSGPEAILALPDADPRLPYVRAMRHYARATAFAQRRDRAGFDRELAALNGFSDAPELAAMAEQGVPAPDLLRLAGLAAKGRFALASGRNDEAARLFRAAAEIEEALPYTEPPYWYYPVRQSLGAALHKAGRHEEAREAFRAALARSPSNGWALYGLAASERALGHAVEARAAEAALERAWLGDRSWLRMERL